MPVLHEGRLAGLLTAENVGEYFLIHAATRRAGGRPGLATRLAVRTT
jgi:hypothetical protein